MLNYRKLRITKDLLEIFDFDRALSNRDNIYYNLRQLLRVNSLIKKEQVNLMLDLYINRIKKNLVYDNHSMTEKDFVDFFCAYIEELKAEINNNKIKKNVNL